MNPPFSQSAIGVVAQATLGERAARFNRLQLYGLLSKWRLGETSCFHVDEADRPTRPHKVPKTMPSQRRRRLGWTVLTGRFRPRDEHFCRSFSLARDGSFALHTGRSACPFAIPEAVICSDDQGGEMANRRCSYEASIPSSLAGSGHSGRLSFAPVNMSVTNFRRSPTKSRIFS